MIWRQSSTRFRFHAHDRQVRSFLRTALLTALGAACAAVASRGYAELEPRVVTFQALRQGLRPAHWPILGSPDAQVVLLELFDYTCGSCQEMGQRVASARKRYGNNLAVVILPVSLTGATRKIPGTRPACHRSLPGGCKKVPGVSRVSPDRPRPGKSKRAGRRLDRWRRIARRSGESSQRSLSGSYPANPRRNQAWYRSSADLGSFRDSRCDPERTGPVSDD